MASGSLFNGGYFTLVVSMLILLMDGHRQEMDGKNKRLHTEKKFLVQECTVDIYKKDILL